MQAKIAQKWPKIRQIVPKIVDLLYKMYIP